MATGLKSHAGPPSHPLSHHHTAVQCGNRHSRGRIAPPPTAPRLPAATQGEHQSQTAPAAAQERLRVGLSDPDTKLVLPWFVTTLTDAVNQGKSANETGKALLDGL
ncbi:hypothetical protein WJ972_12945 [Achromobacter insuavis]